MKNKLLFVPGIILVVFGAIGLIANIISLRSVSELVDTLDLFMSYLSANVDTEGLTGIVRASAIVGIISSVVYLIAGIFGIKYASKPEKANVCMVMGILMIAMCIVNFIFALISNNKIADLYQQIGQTNPTGIGTAIASLIIGLILPVLYTMGAMQNKKAVANTSESDYISE